MMKVYIESMGCDSNLADTNKIKTYFKINNVNLTENYKEADYIILMSCGFNKLIMEDNIKRLEEFKNSKAKIILGGCIPKINKKITADYYFGPKELDRLDEIFKFKNKIKSISPEFKRKDKKIIRISTGCEGKCSYCAIKLANGITKSRSTDEIKKDILSGLKEGYSRFVFTAEDVGSWGNDLGEDIVVLLKEIVRMEEDFKIILTTLNPKWFIKFPKLIELLKNEKIEKKLYFSLQSGSNRILKLMNRKYSVEEYISIFEKLKKEIPELKIQSDVLVGFPSESEKDFLKTLEWVKRLDIYFLQVFVYTDMENTASYELKPKVPFEVAKERGRNLIKVFLDKNKGAKRRLVNTNIEYKQFKEINYIP